MAGHPGSGMLMPDDPYAAARIRKTVWGRVTKEADGTWLTVWRFELEASSNDAPGSRESVHVWEDASIGFSAVLEFVAPEEADLVIRTERPAMSAEYYSPTFAAFGIVNDELAEIRAIQGKPRDWYAPFRSRPSRDLGEEPGG